MNNSKNSITKIILLFTFLFCIFASTAQETKVYAVDEYGLKSITPTAIIKDNKVYSVDNSGLRDIVPSQVIEGNKVYEVKNGLKEITPRYIIVRDSIKRN